MPVDLLAEQPDEQKFQQWYGGWASKLNLDPDPDNPLHYYDYRAAFKAGAKPTAESDWHWPSEFKREGHPRMIVDGVNTKTGQTTQEPVDLLAGVEPIQSGVLSWRKAPEMTTWDRIKAIFPDDSAAQSARATNALTYSEMLGIRPSVAYEFHDEISAQMKDRLATEKIITEKKGMAGAASSAWDTSIIGMMANQKAPKPFESVSQAERWFQGMLSMGLDLPFFVAGGVLGGGTPVAGMAGAFGFHSGLRQMLLDRYTKGEVKDAADLLDRVCSAAKETIKGEVIGGFTGGAKVMAPVWLQKMAPGVAPSVGWTAMNELAAMTAAGKLIEGHLPTASDFVDNAAILLTMHAGTSAYQGAKARIAEVKAKLQESFIETGAHPKEIVNRIVNEPIFDPREDIMDIIDRVNAELKATMPPETAEKPTKESFVGKTETAEIPGTESFNLTPAGEAGSGDISKKNMTPTSDLFQGAKEEARGGEIVEPAPSSQAERPVVAVREGATSIKNAVVDAEREARGAEGIETPVTKRVDKKQIEDMVDRGEIDPRELAAKINNLVEIGERPKDIGEDVNHALLYDKKRLQNEHKAVQAEIDVLSEGESPKQNKGEMYWPESDEARFVFEEMKSQLKNSEGLSSVEVDGEVIFQGSGYPQWFRDIVKKHRKEHLSAQSVIDLIDKYLTSKSPLTDRQAKIFGDVADAAMRSEARSRFNSAEGAIVVGADLRVGDKLTMEGEKYKVTAEDEDGYLTLKDGKTLRVGPDDVLPVDDPVRTGNLRDLESRRSEIEDALEANERATKAIGTEQGRALQSRQDMMNEDYSLAAMIRRAKEDGVEITPEIRAKYRKLSNDIEKAQEALQKQEEQVVASNVEKTIRQQRNKEDLSQRKQKRTYKVEELDAEFDSLVKDFNKTIGGQLNVGIDPAGVKILVDMARNRIKKGIVKAEDIVDSIHVALTNAGIEYSKRDIRDAISNYGKTIEMSKEEIAVALREARRQMQLLSALEDAKSKVSPARSGLQRDPVSDRVRELQREVHEAMKESGIQRAGSPEQQWKTALDAAKKRLTNSIADVTKQIETGERERKGKGIEYDAEAKTLKEHLDFLKKVRDALEEAPAEFAPEKPGEMPTTKQRQATPEQRINAALKAAERSAGRFAREAMEGKAADKAKPVLETPELAWARDIRDTWKEHVMELREAAKVKRDPEDIAREQFRKRKEREIAEYERRLRDGDFTTKPKKEPPTLGAEELRLEHAAAKAKHAYMKARVEDQLAQRGTATIVKDSVIESLNLIKAIKSAFDLSAPGRQGLFAFLSHPVKGVKNLPEMLRAAGSEEAAFRIETELKSRENAKLYEKAGVSLTERNGTGSTVEEMYRSRWAELVPGIPASERAFVSYLNLMRADLFDAMYKNNFSKRAATPAELKALGDYVNQATGRGTLKGYENALNGLGTFLWAPRLVLSRFQMILGAGMMPGGGRTAATRWAVAKEYGRILASLSIIYAVNDVIGEPVEDDPRSSDFGKIKVGNTRIDVLAGISQVTVFMSRIISGETKGLKSGAIRPISGDNVPYGGLTTWGVISNFLRTKLTPALGLGINLLSGKDLAGNKVTMYDIPAEVLVPLSMQDLYDAMNEEGIPAGMALGTLGLFGVGIQTYEEKGARR